jgi:Zn-finger nucleic acid-binding protein
MLCPACGDAEMLVLEYELVEVDYCPRCRGVWLDSGELALIGERAGALHGDLLAALEKQPERTRARAATRRAPELPTKREQRTARRCPVCRKGLQTVRSEPRGPVEVDRCPRGDGLWFDQGELSAVVQAAGGDKENLLARFFAELGGQKARRGNSD